MSGMGRVMVVGLVVSLAVACGGSKGNIRPSSPFREEHARFFDDGVDFTADPSVLDGRWAESWAEELDHRVGGADLVAVVVIHMLRTDVDLERRATYRLTGRIANAMFGNAPGDEVVLPVHEAQSGFASVEGNERRILDRTFVAYVKWYEADDGSILPHWHLSPATPAIVKRTEELVARRRSLKKR